MTDKGSQGYLVTVLGSDFNHTTSPVTLEPYQSHSNVQCTVITQAETRSYTHKHREALHNYGPLSKLRNYISTGLTSRCLTWLLDENICSICVQS